MVWIRRNAIALVALFVALGGTGYAAFKFPANSVGTAQLRNGAVTGAKVRSHSLSGNALASGVLPAAPALHTTTVYGPANTPSCPSGGCIASPAGTVDSLPEAVCPQGDRVLGGGYVIESEETVVATGPTPQGNGWDVTIVFTQPHVYDQFGPDYVSAVCGSFG